MKPTVFKTNCPPNTPEQIIPHDPVFKFDVTGTGNREELQYHIMHNGKRLLWCVHDCLGRFVMAGFETAHQALLAFEAYSNAKAEQQVQ
jgi:hypothetical protein